jgi:hypothetical protein
MRTTVIVSALLTLIETGERGLHLPGQLVDRWSARFCAEIRLA